MTVTLKRTKRSRFTSQASCLTLFLALLAPTGARAALQADEPIREIQNVSIQRETGAQVPRELAFTDQNSKPVRLDDYFDGARPVLLSMNYTNCPMLCSMQLNGLADGLRGLDTEKDTGWTPGGNFVVLTVSMDHEEKPERAKQTHDRYIRDLGRPAAAGGWHFLTGSQENIRSLTDAIGFGFKKIPNTNDYAHKAALMVLTPEGKISRYLNGVEYEPKTLRLSMIEASEGKVGSAKDKFLLFWNCYMYDPNKQRYTVGAVVVMRIGAALTVLVLALVLGFFWWRAAFIVTVPSEQSASPLQSMNAEPAAGAAVSVTTVPAV